MVLVEPVRIIAMLIVGLVAASCSAQVLPPPDVGFGFYYSPGRCKFGNERLYFEDMKKHGCNTFAPQANELPGQSGHSAAENISRQLNLAAQVGLLDRRFPIVCYSVGPRDLQAALRLKAKGVEWPELIQQSIDEPNATQEVTLKQYHAEAHTLGYRIGTAVAGYVCTGYDQQLPWCKPEDIGKHVPGMGKYLDLWILLVGTWDEGTRAAAREQGAAVGAYLAYPSSPLLDRWTFGLWAWRAKTEINLMWAYIDKTPAWDYSRVDETEKGPLPRPGGAGYAEGIMDYRVLQAVRDLHTHRGDAFLHEVERKTTLGWWPRGYIKDDQDKEKPTVDMDAVRDKGMAILKRPR